MKDRRGPSIKQFLRPVHLTAVFFFTVSGGPYGLEPLLAQVGGTWALALIVLVPFVWSIPTIFMVLELNGMMPHIGGYYQWVKEGLGTQWGFLEGWWTWLFIFTDLAIYPTLFVQYLSFVWPEAGLWHVPIALLVIWSCALLNLSGILTVGRGSLTLGIAVIFPFALLFAVLFCGAVAPTPSHFAPHALGLGAFGLGLTTVMWNYLGWDNASTLADEVDRPVRSYLVSVVAAFVFIVVMYTLAVWSGIASGADASVLQEEGFPVLGQLISGRWLGILLAAGGMASALGLFVSSLLAISRLPKAMADDRLLPAAISRVHTRTGAPYVSVLICAVVVSGMILWGFTELLIIDVTLYGAALSLEFVALIVLRIRRPEAERPFRIPFNTRGIVAMSVLPALCSLVAFVAATRENGSAFHAVLFAVGALLTGPLVWRFARRGIAPQ